MISTTNICVSCENTYEGNYCSHCGEKLLKESDYSLKKFSEHSIDMFTHVDSKFLKSFKYLLFRPGFLTLEYWRGVRVKYAKPLQIFIVVNAAFYLISHTIMSINVFKTPLYNHTVYGFYSEYAKELVKERLVERGVTLNDYAINFNITAENLSKSLIILLVPLFALLSWMLFYKWKKYFIQHLIKSLHFYSFILIIVVLMQGFAELLRFIGFESFLNASAFDQLYGIVGLVMIATYLWSCFAKLYPGLKKWLYIPVILIFLVEFAFSLSFYRFILFLITFNTT